ncbi:MAG TPA: PD-(D/E)XK nuclease family protein [Bacteroides sp.]|nr:PD-(D/E)XK nuclease family protein [Bacteroides sp.]
MKPFLEILAIHLIRSFGRELGDCVLILPNRRSGLFLRHHLAAHTDQVMWVPRMYPVSDFIDRVSILEQPDPVELQFILYDLYAGMVEQPDSFDDFYYWGEMMTGDFDELDKYRVDADMIFRNIADLKELEDPAAGLEQEQVDLIRRFWGGFHEGSHTPEKEKFIHLWELLPRLYHGLRGTLKARGLGTPGMQYREIAERIDGGGLEWPEGERVVVAGFNALNSCEKRIFSWLRERGAAFFWDYDERYVKDASWEAGRFLRENLKHFPPQAVLEEFSNLEQDKEIRILELPTDVLQAKMVHQILETEGDGGRSDCTDTAVVLCDEELLIPLIMSLPPAFEEINVTMGYPMSHAPVFSFTDQLITLQNNIRKGKEGADLFYHRDVTSILAHPCMHLANDEAISGMLGKIAGRNMMYVSETLFTGELERKIFRRMGEGPGFIDYFRQIYQHLLDLQTDREDRMHRDLDREFIFQVLVHLNKLERLMLTRQDLSVNTLIRLFRKILASLRVPFEGEPLAGLQVMGILETRLLDFRHVILLSMNEEVMPRTRYGHSFIPYALRAAYGMPVREEMDAIYAYYFYRLIQRAGKVDLLFNSKTEGVRSGEMSRYLTQLKYERGIPVTRPGLELRAQVTRPLTIDHSDSVNGLLAAYLEGSEQGKYLSPSAVNTYLDCPLKFYLRYLRGIGGPEEVQEEVDAAGFGTVVHDSIHRLYQVFSGNGKGTIGAGDLLSLLNSDKPARILEEAFIAHHFRGDPKARIEGRNIITFRVMLKYLGKILETDRAIAPLQLVSSEKKYHRVLAIRAGGNDLRVLLGGKIDRVDRVSDALRVIDYKTGLAKQNFPHLEGLFDPESPSRNSAALQVLFYAWMVSGQHPGERITPGIYVMRELYADDFDPRLILGSHSAAASVDDFSVLEEEFVARLTTVLERIFSPGIPFHQTDNETHCRNCDFSRLCSRFPVQGAEGL